MAEEAEQHDAAGGWKAKEMAVSPVGRPLDYQGSESWASRIISRTLTADSVGAGAGFFVGATKGQPALRPGASVGSIFLWWCAKAHTGCDPDWVNGVLGGLASVAVLEHLHRAFTALRF